MHVQINFLYSMFKLIFFSHLSRLYAVYTVRQNLFMNIILHIIFFYRAVLLCPVLLCFYYLVLNTLRPRQNWRHFADDTFKRIFLNENNKISIKISLKFVPNGPINKIPALVQIMAWRRPGDKPLPEPMWLVQRRIYASLGLNELTIIQSKAHRITGLSNWPEP